MKLKADIVVIGSGAGGATVAKELAKSGKDVLLVERGPFTEQFGTQRFAMGFYDRCGLRTSKEGVIVYRTLMAGGTTVVSCGNGLSVLEEELSDLGVDISDEIEEVKTELGIKPLANRLIGKGSMAIMHAGNKLGFDMEPMPKFINSSRCVSCGLCVLGCKTGAKWSAIDSIKEMHQHGGSMITGIDVKSIVISKNRAIGLVAKKGQKQVRIHANKIVLSAGGFGSAVILKRSGFHKAGNKFFADLFNVTYGVLKDKRINFYQEPSMAVVSTKFQKKEGFILSPFIDVPLILRWVMPKHRHLRADRYNNLIGIMTKIKDDSSGKVTKNERFFKVPSSNDHSKLDKGAGIAKDIFQEMEIRKQDIFSTKPRGAHPGGSASIGTVVDNNLKTEIDNLFVCDASVLPSSPGAPPIVTIVALGKRLAKNIIKN